MKIKTNPLLIAGVVLILHAGSSAAQPGCGLDMDHSVADKNYDGYLSWAEAGGTPIEPVFARLDLDRDGLVDHSEFNARCASLGYAPQTESIRPQQTSSVEDDGPNMRLPGVVGDKIERQGRRQQSNVDRRIDRETDRAADSMMKGLLDSVFGN